MTRITTEVSFIVKKKEKDQFMLEQKLPHANLDVNTPRSFSHEMS